MITNRLRHARVATVALIALAFGAIVYGQEISQFAIGEVEYFGYAGLNLPQIQAAIPFHKGSVLTISQMKDAMTKAASTIQKLTGRQPTDIEPVCCDARGAWMVYVGLPGKSSHEVSDNPAPTGNSKLPAKIVQLYDQTIEGVLHAVRAGAKEDDSKGYFLSSDPSLHKKQLAMRAYAVSHGPLIIKVLQTSSDSHQREAAADALGYAQQTPTQLAALAHASRDPDGGVRNNAVRALVVLAYLGPKTAGEIPAQGFIDLLSSGSWTDRNKASLLLETLTRTRNPKLLAALRRQALAPLIEMAHWDLGHGSPAQMILGRIAGIPEADLQKMISTGQVDAIIRAAKAAKSYGAVQKAT